MACLRSLLVLLLGVFIAVDSTVQQGRNADSLLGQFNGAVETHRKRQFSDTFNKRHACDAVSPYREIDGRCNNLAKPAQGSTGSKLIRVIDNAYNDGLSTPRTTSVVPGGVPLPPAREVSRAVFDNKRSIDRRFTALGMHFGQIASHDVTAVRGQRAVDCSDCSMTGECFSIPIADDDPVFGATRDCLHFARTSFVVDTSGVRQHPNFITSYLDASFLYGSDAQTAAKLRDDTGKMVHEVDSETERELLPHNKELKLCAGVDEDKNIYCGLAGDVRAAEQPGLTALHTLFLREHNRIVEVLGKSNSALTGDDLYQKARKIVIAEWQHILYTEYLSLIIGKEDYENAFLSASAPYAYDADIDATTANHFATAAFRFGHTTVPFHMARATKRFRSLKDINMNEASFNATYIYDESIRDGAVDSILRGMTMQTSCAVDGHISNSITDNLFGDPGLHGDGFDLTALNIQRGRDHGIPSFLEIREKLCGLDDEITTFRDLFRKDLVTRKEFRKLATIYENVRDIDAFVGLVMEKHLPNTLVGPTLSCLFADQFSRLKFGDRFFYKNADQFTQDQIAEIEKASMARLMCDNVNAVTKLQPLLFLKPEDFGSKRNRHAERRETIRETLPLNRAVNVEGTDNRRIPCTDIPSIDLSKFD